MEELIGQFSSQWKGLLIKEGVLWGYNEVKRFNFNAKLM